MPRFYCEYCDAYLKSSSKKCREEHLSGRRHINAKIDFFLQLIREKSLTQPQYTPPTWLLNQVQERVKTRFAVQPYGGGPPQQTQPPPAALQMQQMQQLKQLQALNAAKAAEKAALPHIGGAGAPAVSKTPAPGGAAPPKMTQEQMGQMQQMMAKMMAMNKAKAASA